MPTMRVLAVTLLLVGILAGCAAERNIYRDSDGRIQEQWNCPYVACLGIGHRPMLGDTRGRR
jgi:hypothetical protein